MADFTHINGSMLSIEPVGGDIGRILIYAETVSRGRALLRSKIEIAAQCGASQ